MAVVQTVTCDRCREPIAAGRSVLTVETSPLRDRQPAIDLCQACADALIAWLAAGPTPQTFALGTGT